MWTVDTWRVRPGREDHFLSHCRALAPDPLILYRDLEETELYWSPAKWESLDQLKEWRSSAHYGAAARSVEADVSDQQTHVMGDVPGFHPHAAGGAAS